MKKGNLGFGIVKEATNSFDLTGMVAPNFMNTGNTTAVINNYPVKPGAQFPIASPNIELQGAISISFLKDNKEGNPKNSLHVYWTTVLKQDNC